MEWVQYPEDTEATRTKYDYDTMYRMALAECTTDTGLNQSVEYVYENDRLMEINTPTAAYWFGYGAFGQRSAATVQAWYILAQYDYTNDANRYLQQLEYGNYDTVNYTYDNKGRLLTQTYEDGDTVSYAYDNNGALATVTDSATGRTTTYYYDLTDRMMQYTEKGTNYSHSVGYEYDSKNNLTQLVENINGTDRTTSYTYDDDNRVETVTVDGSSVVYTYDTYGRVTQQVTKHGTTDLLTKDYTFKNAVTADGQQLTSTQIATYKVTVGGVETEYAYTYDGNGNILTVTVGGNTTSYEYDSANQLIRENNQAGDFTHTWEYDDGGNIQNRKEYDYTTGSLDNATPTDEITYTYDDVFWRDLLTEYDGKEIDRDEIGNPLTYDGWTYTWEHGRQLASAEKDGRKWLYTYDANGMRTKKGLEGGTAPTTYVYNGSQLSRMEVNNNVLDFTYDANGTPLTLTYNGTTYYYVTNLQGDVIGIRDANGALKVSYEYNAWGKEIAHSGNTTLYTLNPLRYRGYIYDLESGLYYLQSRYYDPEIGRFINADGFVSTGLGFIGNNMFAYCNNNSIIFTDNLGKRPVVDSINGRETAEARRQSFDYMNKRHIIDLTDALTSYMDKNARDLQEYKKEHGFAKAAVYFYNNVKDGGALDIKLQESWKFEEGKVYLFNGEPLRFDDPGNINFGYVGAVLFPEIVLCAGAGANQISKWGFRFGNPTTFYDDPRDNEMIKYGYSLYEERIS